MENQKHSNFRPHGGGGRHHRPHGGGGRRPYYGGRGWGWGGGIYNTYPLWSDAIIYDAGVPATNISYTYDGSELTLDRANNIILRKGDVVNQVSIQGNNLHFTISKLGGTALGNKSFYAPLSKFKSIGVTSSAEGDAPITEESLVSKKAISKPADTKKIDPTYVVVGGIAGTLIGAYITRNKISSTGQAIAVGAISALIGIGAGIVLDRQLKKNK